MRTLFIYNPKCRKIKNKKRFTFIVEKLSKSFQNLDILESESPKHFEEIIKKSENLYDFIIVGGGDGTFNLCLNVIDSFAYKPTIGILPLGTLNDAAKNLGVSKNYRKALKRICQKQYKYYDYFKVNDHCCSYVATCGSYSDIPYEADEKRKMKFGRFAYYFLAITRLFKKISVDGVAIFEDGTSKRFSSSFILLISGRMIGGFAINKNGVPNDGYIEFFAEKKTCFNSLFYFFFMRNRLFPTQIRNCIIQLDKVYNWDLDGEYYPTNVANVSVISNELRILN